jgi:proteasome lid subunit RPN8/RPN11
MPRAEVEAMLAHAREGYPYEACGVLLGRVEGRQVSRIARMVNRETEMPHVRYQIAPEDLLRVQRESRAEGLEIVGFYHSHPDHPARPSETDRRIAEHGLSDGVVHIVVGVEKGERAVPTAWVFRDALLNFEEEPFEVD